MFITINGTLADEFGRAGEPVEVRAPGGRLLGTFTPNQRPPEPCISEEELLRRESDTTGKWYTAAEVEAKLRGLRARP